MIKPNDQRTAIDRSEELLKEAAIALSGYEFDKAAGILTSILRHYPSSKASITIQKLRSLVSSNISDDRYLDGTETEKLKALWESLLSS